MNDVDDALRLIAVLIIIIPALSSTVVSALLLDVVSQVPVLDELFEAGFEGLAVFSSMPILLMVGTELILISDGRVILHQLWPFEEGLRLDLVKELVDRLPEDRVHNLIGGSYWLVILATPEVGTGATTELYEDLLRSTSSLRTISCLSWRVYPLSRGQSSPELVPRLLLVQ